MFLFNIFPLLLISFSHSTYLSLCFSLTYTMTPLNQLPYSLSLSSQTQGRRRNCTSSVSEEDIDDSLLNYLLIITPNLPGGNSTGPISGPASSSASTSSSVRGGVPHHVLAKHPSGDRHPNPDYVPRLD